MLEKSYGFMNILDNLCKLKFRDKKDEQITEDHFYWWPLSKINDEDLTAREV